MTTETMSDGELLGAEAWQLTYDNIPDEAFPDGLRLSTDCPARRIIEPIDPDRYHEFPEHLGHRGHGFERVMQEWLYTKHRAVEVRREVVVPWEHGETHLDLLIDPLTAERLWGCDGKRWLLIELKANKEGSVKAENVRQAQRQRFVIERAVERGRVMRFQRPEHQYGQVDPLAPVTWVWETIDAAIMRNLEYRVVVIDPTTWRIPDPRGVKIELRDERRAELEAEWAAMDTVMSMKKNDLLWAIEWPGKMEKLGLACSCGKCFPPPLAELPRKLAEHAHAHLEAKEEVKFATEVKDYHTGVLKEAMTELRKADKIPRGSWVGHGIRVTLTKAGAILTNPAKDSDKPTII